MTRLNKQPNFHRPGRRDVRDFTPGDDFYECLIRSHDGLDEAASHALNARLVLLLANHVGDLNVLDEAMRIARRGQ